MKRFFSLMLIIACSMGIAFAQETSGLQPTTELNVSQHTAPRGYRGFVELAPFTLSTSGATLNLSTTHGYQFNHHFFLGGGIGYYTYFGQSGETDVPIYIAIQSNVGESMAQFTYGARIGTMLYTKHEYTNSADPTITEIDEGTGGLYFNFNLGLRLGFTPQYAMTIKPQLELLLGGFPTLNVGIGFGFEF